MEKLIARYKKNCFKSNKDILIKKLAIQTFGNVSQRINEKFVCNKTFWN